ncbi:hypothetical protein V6N11_000979 [Hibiscus sabdariffa]|uniref:Uncharacterized protein n=1 Tax=Hibiscus sabdariffa TaxID=183260 RepID=A0ABR2RZ59_9ROSI
MDEDVAEAEIVVFRSAVSFKRLVGAAEPVDDVNMALIHDREPPPTFPFVPKFIVVFGYVLQVNPIVFGSPNAVFKVAPIKQVLVFPEHVELGVNVVGPGSRETPEQRRPEDRFLEFPLGLAADGQVMYPEIVVVGFAVNEQDLVAAQPVDHMDMPCNVKRARWDFGRRRS